MNPPVKILHLSASDTGGAFVFAENLISNTDTSKFKADHLIFSGASANCKIFPIKWIDASLKMALHAVEKLLQFFHEKDKDVRFKFSLGYPGIPYFLLKRKVQDYDIIHLHWINKGFIRIKDLKKLGKPIVWTCHDLWPVSGGCHLSMGCEHFKVQCGNCHFLKHPSASDLSASIFQNKMNIYADLNMVFVSPSQWMDDNISSSGLGKNKKHLRVHNGVNTEIFTCSENSSVTDTFTIGFVAANLDDKNKALHRLIEAIQFLSTKQNIKLLLVGNRKFVTDLHIPVAHEIVSNIQTKEAMAEQYKRMNLLVCTSTIETFPTTLMEAYCCGVKGLGFKVGGIPEIIEAMGDTCVPAFDISALAQAIENKMQTTYDTYQTAQKAKELFGIRQTALAYQKVYSELVD